MSWFEALDSFVTRALVVDSGWLGGIGALLPGDDKTRVYAHIAAARSNRGPWLISPPNVPALSCERQGEAEGRPTRSPAATHCWAGRRRDGPLSPGGGPWDIIILSDNYQM